MTGPLGIFRRNRQVTGQLPHTGQGINHDLADKWGVTLLWHAGDPYHYWMRDVGEIQAAGGTEPKLKLLRRPVVSFSNSIEIIKTERGQAARFNYTAGQCIEFASDGELIPTDKVTVMVSRVPNQSSVASYQSTLFGYASGSFRMLSHCPWEDGTIYWDYENTVAGRLTSAGATRPVGVLERYVFSFGPLPEGQQIHYNGAFLAGQSPAVTRTPIGTAYYLGSIGGGSSSDPSDIDMFVTCGTKVSGADIALWSANPEVLLEAQETSSRWASSGATVQILRPSADLSAGAWLPSTGSDLYAMLDEAVADDADYIYVASASTCDVDFQPGSAPTAGDQNARVRAKATGGTLTIYVMEGASVRGTLAPSLTASWQTFTIPLSGVVDYTALFLRLVSS